MPDHKSVIGQMNLADSPEVLFEEIASRRLMVLNLRLSVREYIIALRCRRQETEIICDLRISKKLQANLG